MPDDEVDDDLEKSGELMASAEDEPAILIYYDQKEIEANHQNQKKDQFADLLRMRDWAKEPEQIRNKFNILEHLPKEGEFEEVKNVIRKPPQRQKAHTLTRNITDNEINLSDNSDQAERAILSEE